VRHRVYGKHLGRDSNQRTALFKSLVGSLILHGSIETTQTKATAIRGLVDKVINQAKTKETRRLLQSFLTQKTVVEKLVNEVAPSMPSRNSGYTSIIKLGNRLGDNAMVVRMSLLLEEAEKPKKAADKQSLRSQSDLKEVKLVASEVTPEVVEEVEETVKAVKEPVAKKAPRKVAKK
jgi:large subunit ribosomal protein L17